MVACLSPGELWWWRVCHRESSGGGVFVTGGGVFVTGRALVVACLSPGEL